MYKSNISISSLFFFAFLFFLQSCSKEENTVNPVPDNNTDSILPKPEYKPPELFPLAFGAQWNYSFYHYYDSYVSFDVSHEHKHYGYLQLHVTQREKKDSSETFVLNTYFHLDSTFIRDWYGYYYSTGGEFDTSYTIYTQRDTMFVYNILFKNDTLWYEEKEKYTFMMPGDFIPDHYINLKIFEFPWRINKGPAFFDRIGEEDGASKTGNQYIYSINVQTMEGPSGKVLIVKEKGGFVSLEAKESIGGNSGYREELKYGLKYYIPGVSPPP